MANLVLVFWDLRNIREAGNTYENSYVPNLVNQVVAQEMVTDDVFPDEANKDGMKNQNGQVQHVSQK